MQKIDFRYLMNTKAVGSAAVLCFLAGGIFVFIELAEEILEGEAFAFDEWLLLALRNPADPSDPIGPGWLEEAAVEFTALGGYPLIGLFTLLVAGYLTVAARRGASLYVLASVGGGAILSTSLKAFFERPRPDLVEQLDIIHTASFPSGHATAATVCYLTLGALLLRYAKRGAEIVYIVFVTGFIAALVGFTRVYLGVHWPSDVLAGWALGVSWAALVWCVVVTIEYRQAIGSAGSRALERVHERVYWRGSDARTAERGQGPER